MHRPEFRRELKKQLKEKFPTLGISVTGAPKSQNGNYQLGDEKTTLVSSSGNEITKYKLKIYLEKMFADKSLVGDNTLYQ